MTKSQLLDLVDSLRTDLESAKDTIKILRTELAALKAENVARAPAHEEAKSEVPQAVAPAPVLSHKAFRMRWIAQQGGRTASKADVDAAYAAYLSGDESTPAPVAAPVQFVTPVTGETCGACGGTGRYVGSGVTGQCFRCEGKGVQTTADMKRNAYYDLYAARRAARS